MYNVIVCGNDYSIMKTILKQIGNLKNSMPDALPNTSNESEDTFYYDFNMKPVSIEDFPLIEEKMQELVQANI